MTDDVGDVLLLFSLTSQHKAGININKKPLTPANKRRLVIYFTDSSNKWFVKIWEEVVPGNFRRIWGQQGDATLNNGKRAPPQNGERVPTAGPTKAPSSRDLSGRDGRWALSVNPIFFFFGKIFARL